MSAPALADCDVIVIGGGPAGAATALHLARAGRIVVLIERSTYDDLRLGETLPPAVNPMLRDLGLWSDFLAMDPVPSYQTASAWGAPDIAARSFILSAHGHGWHVDRARFDALIASAAEAAGANVQRDTVALEVKPARGSVQLRVHTGRTERVLRAAELLE